MLSQLTASPRLSDRMDATGGRPTGFDYLRFGLATLVICFHAIITCYGPEVQRDITSSFPGVAWNLILPMFFALSGFLVAGSLERQKSIAVFLGLRVFRIFPALAMDTLVCALLLGPLLTTLPLADYLSHPQFHAYFQNILGIIHFELPGVFDSNPSHKVNGQLWTIPVELECYIVLGVLGLLGLRRYRRVMLLIFCALLAYSQAKIQLRGEDAHLGRVLLLCFCSGVSFYQFREFIRLNAVAALVALAAAVACLAYPKAGYFMALPATYVTVYLGLLNPRKSTFLESGDYSYGIFLYGYPLQQVVVQLVPFGREWYGNLLLSIPLALLFAMASWHLVEKRVMAHKAVLFTLHQGWTTLLERLKSSGPSRIG
ncbi:acyltransferase family protein [Duganella sp. CY15W]|uniref:acyltransferase family protein n=1 Tax=Duganella sp. CY15W TaxID=2692172 RepID=UPI0013680639|nr:acyltransferase family protein [Duganella sp. CY15W]